jgi:diacylglycerol O-acyltransferase / wax synthase
VAVKMHHCLGDGISALGLLDRLLDADADDPLRERRTAPVRAAPVVRPWRLLGGLLSLAGRGTAPRHPVNRSGALGAHRLVAVALPWPEVRRAAGTLDVRPHELLVGVLADALVVVLGNAGLLADGRPLRAMVPVAMRPPRLDRISGNWTGSVTVQIPTGPMSTAARVAATSRELRSRGDRGEAHAAALVMALAGRLPQRVHRGFTRAVYGPRFMNTVISYMPAWRRRRRCAGAPVRYVVPVLPAAPGIPLTVGVIVADGTAGVGILLDSSLPVKRRDLSDAVEEAFAASTGAGDR